MNAPEQTHGNIADKRRGSTSNTLPLALLVASVVEALTPITTDASDGTRVFSSYPVTNCEDDGPGSLRWALELAQRGDTIDLTSLACGTITLTSDYLFNSSDDITISGPGAAALTVTAARSSRVISHNGNTITISGLTVSDGLRVTDGPAFGGCIYSQGEVHLIDAVVTGCGAINTSTADGGGGCGGAVFADRGVTAVRSRVTGNYISVQSSSYSYAEGAGICSRGPLVLKQSFISGNALRGAKGSDFAGAGAYAKYGATITDSTIASNAGGAVWLLKGQSFISNSTVSGNTGGAILVQEGGLSTYNSTIAFNVSDDQDVGAGIDFKAEGYLLFLESSIVAGNTSSDGPLDVAAPSSVSVVGGKNLIGVATIALPPDTIRDDPMLATLADNGGPTPTHALLPNSPARDAGDNILGLASDQRGLARVAGAEADVGAFEMQLDAIFESDFESAL